MRIEITKNHPLFDLAVRFKLGEFKGAERQRIKAILYFIHYGDAGASAIDDEVNRRRKAKADERT